MHELTVSLVNYNCNIEDLRQTIESLYKSWPQAHLCIHDNGSSNENLAQVKEMKYENLIQGQNKGFGHGHNRAFESCPSSKYHLILNPDLMIDDNCLRQMITYMNDHEEVGLSVPKIFNEDGSVQMLNKRDPSVFNQFARRFLPRFLKDFPWIKKKMDHYIMLDKGYDQSYEVPYMSGCFMLFRTSIFRELKGFDEDFFMYMEDADITRRCRAISKCLFLPQAKIVHKWSRASHKSLKLTWVSIKSSCLYFKKWGL
jgi:GT2 family glycosyltransferase